MIEIELANRVDLDDVLRALREADRAASESARRAIAWVTREVEAFERETGASARGVLGAGLVRGVLGLSRAAQGTLTVDAIDQVVAAACDRLLEGADAGGAFAGADAVIESALGGFTTAAAQACREMAPRDELLIVEWAESEARHAAEIQPQPGALTFALGALWVVKSSSGPWHPRRGVDPQRWAAACRRTFGIDHVPPRLMGRLKLEATWIDMGLPELARAAG